LLREEVARETELGKTINSFVSNGNLCPVDVVLNTVMSALTNANNDVIIIDGFPRSLEQMEGFTALLNAQDVVKLVSVIEVEVSEEVARERVLGRARGEDDKEEIFNNRMKVYTEPLEVIQNFYHDKNILKKIDGRGSIEVIVSEMEQFIKSKI
jgi:adenylate kinase